MSTGHDLTGRVSISSNQGVSDLLKEIFNNKTSLSKYFYLESIKSNWVLNNFDTLQNLTLQLITSVVVASGARASEISFLDSRYLFKHPLGYIFYFGKNIKTSKQNQYNLFLWRKWRYFVCRPIDFYLVKTKMSHKNEPLVLLGFFEPSKTVSTEH